VRTFILYSSWSLVVGWVYSYMVPNFFLKDYEKRRETRMRRLLELFTSKPVTAVLTGAGVTAILQSSSTVTVMIVGFVNSGLMTLKQAVGSIMGANIGTTITAQIVSSQRL